MLQNKIRRGYLVFDSENRRLLTSHPMFDSLAAFLSDTHRDFADHEGVFFEVGRDSGVLLLAFLHNTHRGAGAGGVRFWRYDTLADCLADGLRLSRGMTRKNALAGLWWGGGKGIISRRKGVDYSDPGLRREVYWDFGRFISGLRGLYVTAEDAGTSPTDMHSIYEKTRFTTCILPEIGGSGNPSVATARGVICGIEGACEYRGYPGLSGLSVALQGAGHVGFAVLGFLVEKGARRVVVHDIDPVRIARVRSEFDPKIVDAECVEARDERILAADVDIFSPCALGAILNPRTIPTIRATLVCGAANNQLEEEERDGRALMKRGITYVPDFLSNRMGIVNCADEQYGYVSDDPILIRHLGRQWDLSIYKLTRRVLETAASRGTHPGHEAKLLADAFATQTHPIWGHRGRAIIDSLLVDHWESMP